MPEPSAPMILEHIADALVLLARDGRIAYTNDGFREMVGRRDQDLRGLRWADLVDAEATARLDPIISPNLGEGQVHFNIDLTPPSGVCGTYCLTASQVRDAAGQPVGVLQNFRSMDRLRDMILGLKEVNQAIQREKDRVDHVLDSIADGIFTVDLDLVVRSFSGRMERLTGISAADAIGRPCRDVFHGSKCDTDCPLRWSLDHHAVVDRCHEQLQLPDSRLMPVSVTTAFLNDASGATTGLTGVVRDETELEHLRRELHERYSRHNLVGRSSAMRELSAAIEMLASTDATVLITGETGTGKELVAQAIHHDSPRRDRLFVSVNCAALNDNLLESELFGHVRGAFTGAVHDKPGRFEAAAGGTIFLDEIGDTTATFQAKLLRVLQEKTFERVGDNRSRRTDVRVIAATNKDLRQLVHDGRFREDLYYRLAVIPVHVPPLRERREDIPLLVEHFMEKYRPRYFSGREEQFEGISNRALALLVAHEWPGNVRELEHAIEYAMISTTSKRIERAFLPVSIREIQIPAGAEPVEETGDSDVQRLRGALTANRWNASSTARALGISRTTLWRRMRGAGLLDHP
ncbi:MAG: sigma 54-interacting transcriptional regulator [Acidobacteria bacterium]|nr:sigma 54-interacting transcriptional regulator [Acidobacteriota bacterium]